jgi:hypothetical protein
MIVASVDKKPFYFGSLEWANAELRFCIATLKGEVETSSWKHRLQTVLVVKGYLLEYGYTWQAARIDNWIHRLQPRREAVQ